MERMEASPQAQGESLVNGGTKSREATVDGDGASGVCKDELINPIPSDRLYNPHHQNQYP